MILRPILSKKGNLGVAQNTVVGVMILIFIVFVVLFAISTLNPSSFFTANSDEANATSDLVSNLTSGVGEVGKQLPTAFKVIGVVLILGFIFILYAYIKNMNSPAKGGL